MLSLTGEEKGALLLNNLAPEFVEQVLAKLAPERRTRLRALMTRMQTGPETQPILEGLLRELESSLHEKDAAPTIAPPSLATFPRLAEPPAPPRNTAAFAPAAISAGAARPTGEANAAPPARAAAPAPEPAPAPSDVPDALIALARLPAERISRALADESPRIVALILNALDIELAGDVFKRLAPAQRAEVSLAFSAQALPSPEIQQRIAQAVVTKAQQLTDKPPPPSAAARNRKMADMLRLLDKPERVQVLEALENKDPALCAAIKELLYRLDDVLRIDNRSMQKILMEIDTKSLALALKDVGDDVKERFMTNLSKRAQENLQEELDMLRSAPKDQVEQSQKNIIAVIQRLDLAGELVMSE